MPQSVEQNEVVDCAANRVDVYACLFQLSGVCLALIAQWIVLCSDDERGRQALELVGAGAERRNIRIVARLRAGGVELPSILVIRFSIDAGIGRRNKSA